MFPDRRAQRLMQHTVYAPDHPIGESLAEQFSVFDSAVFTKIVIEFLYLRGCEKRNSLFAERRLDILFRVGYITLHGAVTHSALHIFREPFVEPFSERHIAVLCELRVTVFLNSIVELIE